MVNRPTCQICGMPVARICGQWAHQHTNGTAYVIAYDAADIHPATVQGPS